MKRIPRTKHALLFCLLSLFFIGCFPPKPNTLRSPAFLQALVTVTGLAGNDMLANDAVVNNIAQNNSINVIASATGNPAVTSVTIRGSLTWRCFSGDRNHVTGVVNNVPIAFKVNPVASPSSMDITISPFTQILTTCGGIAPPATQSAIDITGSFVIIASNGSQSVTSKTFVFNYTDMGMRQP